MGKNYRRHQIGIWEIAQLNSNKHGFKSSRSLLFYKNVFLKFCRIRMKTPETCTSNKKKLNCRCFLMNFVKCLRTRFYRTLPHGCYWIFFIYLRPCDTDIYIRNIIFSNISEILFMCITDYFNLFSRSCAIKTLNLKFLTKSKEKVCIIPWRQ